MEGRVPKWYTAARRFPQLIGRTPDGSQLPGGPYTITQLVVGAVLVILVWNTTGLWARFGLAGNIVVGPAIVIGGVIAAGKLPFEMRNPLVVGAGWINALSTAVTTPKPVMLRPPHRAGGGRVLMITDTRPETSADRAEPAFEPELEASAPPAPTSADTSSELPALTGVQQLLAAARS